MVAQRLPDYGSAARFESGLRDMNALVNSSIGFEAMGYSAQEVAVVDQALAKTTAELRELVAERLRSKTEGPEHEAWKSVAAGFAKYDKAVAGVVDMKSAGAVMAATFLTTAQKEYQSLIAETALISRAQLDGAGQDVAAASASAARVQMFIGVATVLALVAGTLLTLLLARLLLGRMRLLSASVSGMADGDLHSAVPARGRDELGRLMRDLDSLRQRMQASIAQVRDASESVRVAADEISAGNSDLSQRTETQASSLQQTAASMEEISATVKNSADTARQATQLAASASTVAAKGGEVVDQVVGTMAQISESSRRIADIIGTVDGIAFQTNILALNAAVEAARAGEQGRGFAVVAGEVRSLAQRSAEAAREIKTLIGASVERVESGSRLVGEAGQTMGEIVTQVKRVSDLISEISAATQEQTSGIGQVSSAVTNLDEVTQQNAALVEEAAAAAESLRQQSVRLVDSVSVFRVT